MNSSLGIIYYKFSSIPNFSNSRIAEGKISLDYIHLLSITKQIIMYIFIFSQSQKKKKIQKVRQLLFLLSMTQDSRKNNRTINNPCIHHIIGRCFSSHSPSVCGSLRRSWSCIHHKQINEPSNRPNYKLTSYYNVFNKRKPRLS